MNLPQPGDYIDIHTHDSEAVSGVFAVENLMAHEARMPAALPGRACTFGIHPWYLNNENADRLIKSVVDVSSAENIIAIGEAGFDKLRGPDQDLQARVFEAQVRISEELGKPVFIHCVRAWDELLAVHRKIRPKMPWLIHGFRGSYELATQLLSKGFYLSFWFAFVMRNESSGLLSRLPRERIFLETDGSDTAISTIYEKVAADLNISDGELRSLLSGNLKVLLNFRK